MSRLRKVVISVCLVLMGSGYFMLLGKAEAQAASSVCEHRVRKGENLTKMARKLFPKAAKGRKAWAQLIFQDNGLLDLLIAHNTHLKSIHTLSVGDQVRYPCQIEVKRPKDYYKPIIVVDNDEFIPKGKTKKPFKKQRVLADSTAYTKLLGRSDPGKTRPTKSSDKGVSVEAANPENSCTYQVKKGDRLTKLMRRLYPNAAKGRKAWAQLIYQDDGLLDLLVKHNPKLKSNPSLKVGMQLSHPCEIKVAQEKGERKPRILSEPDDLKLKTLPSQIGLSKHKSLQESNEACLYTVAPGDNLSRMTQKFYPGVVKTRKEWLKILYQKNGLIDLLVKNNDHVKSVDLIYPGMQIVYPCDISLLERKEPDDPIVIAEVTPKKEEEEEEEAVEKTLEKGQTLPVKLGLLIPVPPEIATKNLKGRSSLQSDPSAIAVLPGDKLSQNLDVLKSITEVETTPNARDTGVPLTRDLAAVTTDKPVVGVAQSTEDATDDKWTGPKLRVRNRLRYFLQGIHSEDSINNVSGELYSQISLAAQVDIAHLILHKGRPRGLLGLRYELRRLDFEGATTYSEDQFRSYLHSVGTYYERAISHRWAVVGSFDFRQESVIRATATNALKIENVFLPQLGAAAEYQIRRFRRGNLQLLGGVQFLIPRTGGESNDIKFNGSWRFHLIPQLELRLGDGLYGTVEWVNDLVLLDLGFSDQLNFQSGLQFGVSYQF